MKKIWKLCGILALLALLLLGWDLWSDHNTLTEQVIRLHVVGASDTEQDQTIKLQVRDAILACLEKDLTAQPDTVSALSWLETRLEELEAVANETMLRCGVTDTATVTLSREAFDTRVYDTFTLPAGVYESLRIRIGEAEGKNWWCVVFPRLCLSSTAEDFTDAAAMSGFSDRLTGTIAGEEQYEVRFYLLDLLGRIENFFFS